MTTGSGMLSGAITVREAVPADNAALIALTAACPMNGDIRLCVHRAPDFFALNRLEGDRWWVGVVDGPDGAVAGSVAITARQSYVHGEPRTTMYLSDLKVHPAYRGGPVADALSRYCRETCRSVGGDHIPTLVMVLAGNRPMERRAGGPRGLPRLVRFATLCAHSVSLLPRRRSAPAPGVERAADRDIEEMAALWRRVAPQRQFAPPLDADGLARWIHDAPGLGISDYWLARDGAGGLRGFFALWDQSSFKQLRVLAYSPRMALLRAGVNVAAPLIGAKPLPPAGAPLTYLTAAHVCVPGTDPAALRALLVRAGNAARGDGYAFITIGLDERDPLAAAVRGLLGQPARVRAYVSTPSGGYTGPSLDDRPLHFEVALV